MQLNGGVGITGNIGTGQTLRVVNGASNASPFTNAGTIVFDPNGSSPSLNVGTLTNTGRIIGVGTVNGSLENTTGTVVPGASPGTLTVNNSYTQGAGGSLEIEVEGTGAGQFDKLAVGGNVTRGGTLALKPSAAYAASTAVGDSVAFLTYGGTRTAVFAQTTSDPALTCPKQLTASYADGTKTVGAIVSDGAACGGGGGDGKLGGGGSPGGGGGAITDPPPPVVTPDTVLGSRPKGTVRTRSAKVTVKFTLHLDPRRPELSVQARQRGLQALYLAEVLQGEGG